MNRTTAAYVYGRMKKEQRQPKRLPLPRETVRPLSKADLKQPAGGDAFTAAHEAWHVIQQTK